MTIAHFQHDGNSLHDSDLFTIAVIGPINTSMHAFNISVGRGTNSPPFLYDRIVQDDQWLSFEFALFFPDLLLERPAFHFLF